MTKETLRGGLGLLWKPIVDRVEHKASDGITYEFIDFWEKLNKIRLWQKSNEPNVLNMVTKSVMDFSSDDLKNFGVWDSLSDALKTNIENSVITKMDVFNQAHPTEKIVKHHKVREDYVGIPRSFTCHECGATKNMTPALVIQRAKVKGITVEEFEKTFVCSECKPLPRGKKCNPKYANYPRVMKCNFPDCKVEFSQQPSLTEKLMTDKGLTLEAYCSSWFCKEHRPKKVHHFTQMKLDREAKDKKEGKAPKVVKVNTGEVKHRGKKASGKYADMPKGLTCCVEGCGFFQKLHPSLVMKTAEGKGIAIDIFYKNWKCKAHREKGHRVVNGE